MRPRRPRPPGWLAAALCAASLLGCQSPTYYEEYRAAHPDFRAELPREGAGLRETLASLHAPSRVESIETRLESLLVFAVTEPVWTPLTLDEIRSGAEPSPEGRYVVVATLTCRSLQGLREDVAERTAWYLLPNDALAAWDHYGFRTGCDASNAFRAARGEQIPVERAITERIAARGQKPRIDLVQAYQRGLAYFEAGRLDEARLMLMLGEAGYRTATADLEVGDRAPDSLVEATRLRAHLMRALGVAPR